MSSNSQLTWVIATRLFSVILIRERFVTLYTDKQIVISLAFKSGSRIISRLERAVVVQCAFENSWVVAEGEENGA